MTIEPQAGRILVRARHRIPLGSSLVFVPEKLRLLIETYVNFETDPAQRAGLPFLDWRPTIGQFMFPSATTGHHLSCNAVKRILRAKRLPKEDIPGDMLVGRRPSVCGSHAVDETDYRDVQGTENRILENVGDNQ